MTAVPFDKKKCCSGLSCTSMLWWTESLLPDQLHSPLALFHLTQQFRGQTCNRFVQHLLKHLQEVTQRWTGVKIHLFCMNMFIYSWMHGTETQTDPWTSLPYPPQHTHTLLAVRSSWSQNIWSVTSIIILLSAAFLQENSAFASSVCKRHHWFFFFLPSTILRCKADEVWAAFLPEPEVNSLMQYRVVKYPSSSSTLPKIETTTYIKIKKKVGRQR